MQLKTGLQRGYRVCLSIWYGHNRCIAHCTVVQLADALFTVLAQSACTFSFIDCGHTLHIYYKWTSKINKLFEWKIIIVTSLFSFKSILQCSLDTWGSWIRISHSGFLWRSQNTRHVRRGGSARQNVARYTTTQALQSVFNLPTWLCNVGGSSFNWKRHSTRPSRSTAMFIIVHMKLVTTLFLFLHIFWCTVAYAHRVIPAVVIKQDVKVAILKEDNVPFLSLIDTWMALHMQYRKVTIFFCYLFIYLF